VAERDPALRESAIGQLLLQVRRAGPARRGSWSFQRLRECGGLASCVSSGNTEAGAGNGVTGGRPCGRAGAKGIVMRRRSLAGLLAAGALAGGMSAGTGVTAQAATAQVSPSSGSTGAWYEIYAPLIDHSGYRYTRISQSFRPTATATRRRTGRSSPATEPSSCWTTWHRTGYARPCPASLAIRALS
jgi:hypothetical protein